MGAVDAAPGRGARHGLRVPGRKPGKRQGLPVPGLALVHLLEQAHEVVGVLFLHREDALEHPLGGRVLVADVVDHLAIAVDRDALRDEIFLDHVDQVLALDVFRVAA